MITNFGKILRIIRINSGDSARTMAKKLGISASYLSAIETGKRYIPENIEKLICDNYNLTQVDKEKLHNAMISTKDRVKINLTELSEKKKQLLFAISKSDLDDETIDRLCEAIKLTNGGDDK